jgi:hypothetical protein
MFPGAEAQFEAKAAALLAALAEGGGPGEATVAAALMDGVGGPAMAAARAERGSSFLSAVRTPVLR